MGKGCAVEIQSLGGAGFWIKGSRQRVLIDPYLGGSPKEGFVRREAPPVQAEDLLDTHVLLSTHGHGDHCDATLLPFLARRTDCRFIGPRKSVERMRMAGLEEDKTETVQPGDRLTIDGLRIRVHPGYDPKEESAVVYSLTVDGFTIVHNGDSKYSDVYARIGAGESVDLAMLNYGSTIFMTAEMILKAALDLRCRTLVPMHWDLYEAFYASPHDLIGRVPDSPFEIRILQPGESMVIS